MGTIGVYDADFFKYENVVPNLECAKLVTYYRTHNSIAILTPGLQPQRYTKFIIRKEYNDGLFPREYFLPNCDYGGRAFTAEAYKQLPPIIEHTIPDMHIYDKYIDHFGKTKIAQKTIKRIINCSHIRLAPNSEKVLPLNQIERNIINKSTGFFFHDYDLSGIKAYEIITELQSKYKYAKKPMPFGNKYPIRVGNMEELKRWLLLNVIPGGLYLEYHGGIIENQTLNRMLIENTRTSRQLLYNISAGCKDETDFLLNRLPEIFKQVLFLRRNNFKILLIYDDDLIITPELQNIIEIWNCWLSFSWIEGREPLRQTLYAFCRDNAKFHYNSWAYYTVVKLPNETIQNAFQWIRINNYDLFKMFYDWESVYYKEGEIINEWRRD